jgi:hypothetical protein
VKPRAGQSLTEELRREAIDDASRRLRKTFQEWDDWLIRSNCGVVEQYCKHDLGVHVHGFAKWQRDSKKLCLVSRSKSDDSRMRSDPLRPYSALYLNPHRPHAEAAHYYGENLVLIDVRELVEFPEGIAPVIGASMVRGTAANS